MKLGLISDIHGDSDALERAWDRLMAMAVDRVVCAGDLVGYGRDPDRAVAFLREWQVASVRGNHDRWALERGPGGTDEFGGGTPDAETLAHLAALPTSLVVESDLRIVVIVHGSPSSDMEFVTQRNHPPPVLRGYLKSLGCDLLVVGHTHRPMWYQAPSGRLVVNPGSIVSEAAVDSSRTFAVVDTESMTVTFHDAGTGIPRTGAPWT